MAYCVEHISEAEEEEASASVFKENFNNDSFSKNLQDYKDSPDKSVSFNIKRGPPSRPKKLFCGNSNQRGSEMLEESKRRS